MAGAGAPAPRRIIRRPRRLRSAPGGRLAPVGAGTVPQMRRRPRRVIDLRSATKVYDSGTLQVAALRGISLVIERGDFVAIMGSSGSGKSTLMNILGALDVPTAGDYLIDGVNVRSMDEDELADLRNRKIGFVFQSFNLVPRTSALANVELPLAYARIPRDQRRRRAADALTQVGMRERLHHAPAELSGGQQQRVAVARALVTNPTLILADEPTGNLDSKSSAEVLGIFRRLHVEGRTVVIITHEPDVAEQARRVIHLADGRVVGDEEREPFVGTSAIVGGGG
jgi:putative ABC transport system ATP-binding protein